jgi:hypothetical protein
MTTYWELLLASPVLVALIVGGVKIVGKQIDNKVENREKIYELQRKLMLEDYKNEIKVQGTIKNQQIATIIGYMWDALHALKCDRVTIMQPHPMGTKPLFLTVSLEVKKTGVSETASIVRDKPIEKMAKFASRLANEEFFIIDNIMNEPIDKPVKIAMQLAGTQAIAVHRLKSAEGYWIGNLVADHTNRMCNHCGKCDAIMQELAKKIQIILPDYEG